MVAPSLACLAYITWLSVAIISLPSSFGCQQTGSDNAEKIPLEHLLQAAKTCELQGDINCAVNHRLDRAVNLIVLFNRDLLQHTTKGAQIIRELEQEMDWVLRLLDDPKKIDKPHRVANVYNNI